MWVFGYGSLMWKVDFPYEKKELGYIRGFKRRFWQGSEDHRGVPGKPGRVVTLVTTDNQNDKVYGIAYKISEAQISSVKQHLDFREKCGYQKKCILFHPKNEKENPIQMEVFVGTVDNPHFLGPATSSDELAKHIFYSVGPSGTNKEYLINLAKAMRKLWPEIDDPHLFELEQLILDLEEKESQLKVQGQS